MDMAAGRRHVAIIGSGVSGLTAAYVLRRDWDVTVYEADDRIGGHAHTHTIEDADGTHRVDSGFIVHNDRTYPLLRRLFDELGVETHATEMSMSIHYDGCGLEYRQPSRPDARQRPRAGPHLRPAERVLGDCS